MRVTAISLAIAFCLSIGHANAQNISDEAMHHFDRGQAAVEMAKSPTDYEDAIKEFEKAATLAPDWPDVYYNLGLIQEKLRKYDDAIKNLTKYLELSPNASDVREVKRFIAEIEYKMEKAKAEYDKIKDFIGTWLTTGQASSSFVFTAKKGVLIAKSSFGMGATSPKFVSTQVDGKNLKLGKFVSDHWALHHEWECHFTLITKTLMRGYCNTKIVRVRDPENADLVGNRDRYTTELRKR